MKLFRRRSSTHPFHQLVDRDDIYTAMVEELEALDRQGRRPNVEPDALHLLEHCRRHHLDVVSHIDHPVGPYVTFSDGTTLFLAGASTIPRPHSHVVDWFVSAATVDITFTRDGHNTVCVCDALRLRHRDEHDVIRPG